MYGILFDLDGTLVDSDPIHFEAWQRILAEIHVDAPLIDRKFFDKHISGWFGHLSFSLMISMYNLGRLNADITRELAPHLSEDEQKNLAEKKEILFRQLAKENLQPTKGLDKIFEYIKQNRSKLKIGKEKSLIDISLYCSFKVWQLMLLVYSLSLN
jgi:beta-phosphoglucomutase